MIFRLEKIDLSEVKQLYFLRGYENEEAEHYCSSLVLVGNKDDEFMVELFLSQKTLTISDWRDLMKYAKGLGLKLYAEVLETDFDKFYDNRSFKRVKI